MLARTELARTLIGMSDRPADSVCLWVCRMGLNWLATVRAQQGAAGGWVMKPDLFARCPRCGDLMSLRPDETFECSCGGLYKDAMGRFGSSDGDASITVYRRA
jgi:hypothetical protein